MSAFVCDDVVVCSEVVFCFRFAPERGDDGGDILELISSLSISVECSGFVHAEVSACTFLYTNQRNAGFFLTGGSFLCVQTIHLAWLILDPLCTLLVLVWS